MFCFIDIDSATSVDHITRSAAHARHRNRSPALKHPRFTRKARVRGGRLQAFEMHGRGRRGRSLFSLARPAIIVEEDPQTRRTGLTLHQDAQDGRDDFTKIGEARSCPRAQPRRASGVGDQSAQFAADLQLGRPARPHPELAAMHRLWRSAHRPRAPCPTTCVRAYLLLALPCAHRRAELPVRPGVASLIRPVPRFEQADIGQRSARSRIGVRRRAADCLRNLKGRIAIQLSLENRDWCEHQVVSGSFAAKRFGLACLGHVKDHR